MLKSLSWAVIAFTITAVIAGWYTGSWETGGFIGLIERFVKMPVYCWHDRLWGRGLRKGEIPLSEVVDKFIPEEPSQPEYDICLTP